MGDIEAQESVVSSSEDEVAPKTVPDGSEVTNGDSEQQHIRGGFIVDEEDEDEEYTPMLSESKAQEEGGIEESENVDQGSSGGQLLDAVSTSNDMPTTEPPSSTVAHEQEQDPTASASGDQTDSASHSTLVPSANGVSADHSSVVDPAQSLSSAVQTSAALVSDEIASSAPKARLPNDYVGIYEDRIKEDPRGDLNAWLELIAEYRKRNKIEDARAVYNRFFEVFPTAAEQWVAFLDMELENHDFWQVEKIFGNSLPVICNVQLFSKYLNYVLRRNNITTDKTGDARKVVTDAYEFVLSTVGQDKDSGQIWQDYVQFIRSSPEQIGGTSWQDQQKMDTLRKVYQRAICIPTQAIHALWKEYDSFEMGLNKQTGRKFLQEKSPSYMTARSANTELQNLTRDLKRTTVPTLPPALGFEGDVEYLRQIDLWKMWIDWEKADPLELKDDDVGSYKGRILYVYKQALMALRFWPEMWYDAAEFCFANGLEQDGKDFLAQGITANPESCLLALRRADYIEMTSKKEDSEEKMIQRGAEVREPYDKVLDALYELCGKVKQREAAAITRLRDVAAAREKELQDDDQDDEGGDRDEEEAGRSNSDAALQAQLEAVKAGFEVQLKMLGRTISFVWIALMRAMRRVQGKGKLNEALGGSRQIFSDSRRRGRLTSDVYIANALIEYHCYQDTVATKIFDRGLKLFPEDEHIALEYIKHLIATNDTTNARAVFETTVTRLAQTPANVSKAKTLYKYFHDFESRYGELSQVAKLESRMRSLFPEDPQLRLFAQRYSDSEFDPTAIRPIISPATQARPKGLPLPQVERPSSIQNSPRPSIATSLPQISLSPKRPLDDSDTESMRPAKLARPESPLKGAAGRRLDAQKRSHLRQEISANGSPSVTPLPAPAVPSLAPPSVQLPSEIHYLLSTMPRAESYNATPFNPVKVMDLLRSVDLSRAQLGRRPPTVHGAPAPLPGQFGYTTPARTIDHPVSAPAIFAD